jgi:hypothetical protein
VTYRILWDNGAHASGEFDIDFDTWDEADSFGKEWQASMEALDAEDGLSDDDYEGGYTYEIVEGK